MPCCQNHPSDYIVPLINHEPTEAWFSPRCKSGLLFLHPGVEALPIQRCICAESKEHKFHFVEEPFGEYGKGMVQTLEVLYHTLLAQRHTV